MKAKTLTTLTGAKMRQGGNHASDAASEALFTPSTRLDASRRGFGDYGIQAHDGERTISLEDQQDQVARHLVSFLKRVRKRG